MNFPLASWEWAHPHYTWTDCADIQSHGYLLRSIPFRHWLYFRPIDSLDSANFVVTSVDRRVSSTPGTGVREVARFTPSEELEHAIREKRIGRVFFLDEQENLRAKEATAHHLVVVSTQGWAQWNQVLTIPQNDTHYWPANGREFLWSPKLKFADFLSIPARDLWEQIEKQKNDPTSDCAFAHSTLNWPHDKWMDFILKWKKGTYTELQQVLRAALLGQSSLWQKTAGYVWLINLDNLQTSWHRGRLLPLGSFRAWRDAPLAPGILRDVLCRLSPHFEWFFDEELIATHLATTHWVSESPMLNNEGVGMNWPLITRVDNPTAHERLEATLFWEEWQKTHPPLK